MSQLNDIMNSMIILKDVSTSTTPLLVICWILTIIALAILCCAVYVLICTRDISRYIISICLASCALASGIASIVNYTRHPYTIEFVVSEEYLANVDMHRYFEIPDLRADDTIVITPREEHYDDVLDWYMSHTNICSNTKL